MSISGKLDISKRTLFTGNFITSKPYLLSGKLEIISSKSFFFAITLKQTYLLEILNDLLDIESSSKQHIFPCKLCIISRK